MSLLHIATLLLLVIILFMLLCLHKDNRAEKWIVNVCVGVIATEYIADVDDLNTGIQYMDLRSQKLYARLNSLIDFL